MATRINVLLDPFFRTLQKNDSEIERSDRLKMGVGRSMISGLISTDRILRKRADHFGKNLHRQVCAESLKYNQFAIDEGMRAIVILKR